MNFVQKSPRALMSISRWGGARGLERLACSKYYSVWKTLPKIHMASKKSLTSFDTHSSTPTADRQMGLWTFLEKNQFQKTYFKLVLMRYVILATLSPKVNVIYCFQTE